MPIRFKFAETRSVLTALEVHELEAPASAERLYHVLLSMRIQLVHVAESHSEGKAVVQLSVCELDGAPIKPSRHRAIVERLAGVFASASETARPGPVQTEGAPKPRRAA